MLPVCKAFFFFYKYLKNLYNWQQEEEIKRKDLHCFVKVGASQKAQLTLSFFNDKENKKGQAAH